MHVASRELAHALRRLREVVRREVLAHEVVYRMFELSHVSAVARAPDPLQLAQGVFPAQ